MENNYRSFEKINKLGIESRPDIEKMVKMKDVEFNLWYHDRETEITNLLSKYNLIGNMPNIHVSETGKLKETNSFLRENIVNLEGILSDLKILKEFREKYRKEIKI